MTTTYEVNKYLSHKSVYESFSIYGNPQCTDILRYKQIELSLWIAHTIDACKNDEKGNSLCMRLSRNSFAANTWNCVSTWGQVVTLQAKWFYKVMPNVDHSRHKSQARKKHFIGDQAMAKQYLWHAVIVRLTQTAVNYMCTLPSRGQI